MGKVWQTSREEPRQRSVASKAGRNRPLSIPFMKAGKARQKNHFAISIALCSEIY